MLVALAPLPGAHAQDSGLERGGRGADPDRLRAGGLGAVSNTEVTGRLAKIGFVPAGNSPEEELSQIRRAMVIMEKAIKAARIKPE